MASNSSSMGTSFGIWGLLEENQTIHATLNGLNQTKAEILWMADGEVVQSGGTALTLTDLHVGKSISASLLSDLGGFQTRPFSIDGLVQNTNDPPTGGVLFTGLFEQGEIIEINFSNLKDDDGLGELHFQWYANGNLLPNETGNYLYLSQQLVGQTGFQQAFLIPTDLEMMKRSPSRRSRR